MEGVGTGGDSPGESSIHLCCFPGPARCKAPLSTSRRRCACVLVSPGQGADGNREEELQRATKNLTLFSRAWNRTEQPGPIWRGGVGFLTSQVSGGCGCPELGTGSWSSCGRTLWKKNTRRNLTQGQISFHSLDHNTTGKRSQERLIPRFAEPPLPASSPLPPGNSALLSRQLSFDRRKAHFSLLLCFSQTKGKH